MLKKYLYALAILSFNTCAAQVTDSAKIIKSLGTCWRVLSHEFATIYGLEVEEIKRYSKQRICFSKDSVRLYHGLLYSPKYSVKKVNADNYSKSNYDCTRQKLGISTDSLFEITISSIYRSPKKGTEHKMTDVITYDGVCLYVMVDGVIFKLFDAEAKVQPRSGN